MRLVPWIIAFALWAIAAAAETERLSPDDAYLRGVQAIDLGQPELSLQIANALLVRDPQSFRALILRSRAARNLGYNEIATAAARTAWDQSESDSHKFTSAMVVAQALASDGRRTQAQVWLRRASELAPNEGTRAMAVRDFQYVRARNPWAAEFQFNVTPTDNINNGSARETTQLFGLPFEFQLSGAAQALSGIEYSAGAAGRYRFDQSPHHAQDITFQASHRTYTMSSEAKAAAPGSSGSDFEFSQAAVGYTYTGLPQNGGGLFSLNATLGQTWYAGDAYSSYLRFGGGKALKLSETTKLQVSSSIERQFGIISPDSDALRTDLRFSHNIDGLGVLGISAGNTTSMSDTDVSDFSELRGGIDLKLARPIFGTDVGFGLSVRERDYARSSYDPSGRRDTEVSASVNMVFTNIEKYGFNPTLSINTSRSTSNIGLYDINQTGVKFGIQSAF